MICENKTSRGNRLVYREKQGELEQYQGLGSMRVQN